MKNYGSSFSVIADILGVIGCGLAVFISFRVFPNRDNLTFDYQAILVGILAGLFTLIVGWNIFQMIDWKQEIQAVNKQKEELESEYENFKGEIESKIKNIEKEIVSQKESLSDKINEWEVAHNYQNYLNYYALSDIYACIAKGKITSNVEYQCISNRIEALYYLSLQKDWEHCKSIVGLTLSFIRQKKPKLSPIQIETLLDTLKSANNVEITEEISELIVELKTLKDQMPI